MATNRPNRTVRSAADQIRLVLFPSRPAALVALAIEVAAVVVQLPPLAHVAVGVVVHIAIALTHWRR